MSGNDSALSAADGADSDAADPGSIPAKRAQADHSKLGLQAYFVPLIVLIATAVVAVASFDAGRSQVPVAVYPSDRHPADSIASITELPMTTGSPASTTPSGTAVTPGDKSGSVTTPVSKENAVAGSAAASPVPTGHRPGPQEPGKTNDHAATTTDTPPTDRPAPGFRSHAITGARAMAQDSSAKPRQDHRHWLERRYRLEERAREDHLRHANHRRAELRRRIEQEERGIARRMHEIERGYPPGLNPRRSPPGLRGAYAGYYPI